MTERSKFWNGLPKVQVTAGHIDRALRAMGSDISDLDQEQVGFEGAMLAGSIIAHMDAFDKRIQSSDLLAAVVHEVLTDFLPHWVAGKYGMVHPTDDVAALLQSEHTAHNLQRAAKAKQTRESKNVAEIKATVAQRLSELGHSQQTSAT